MEQKGEAFASDGIRTRDLTRRHKGTNQLVYDSIMFDVDLGAN
jgi:hypothetical protein